MEKHILEQVDPRVLGGRLQDARRTRGLTQQAVADRLGDALKLAAKGPLKNAVSFEVDETKLV